MDRFENSLLSDYYKTHKKKPIKWLRFIDDIFFIWPYGSEELQNFITYAQNYSTVKNMKSNIKFDVNQSNSHVHFLDVIVSVKDGKFITSVYSKPTDAHIYLHVTSSHPWHVIKNIPKGQFLRLRRICSETTDFIKHCNTYINYFTKRGYNRAKMEKHVQDILKTNRDTVLNEKENQQEQERTVFVTRWHPKLSQLQSIIKKHHYIIQNDERLNKVFKTYPLVAFKKAKSIANHVIQNNPSEQETPQSHRQNNKSAPCNNCKKTCMLMSKHL